MRISDWSSDVCSSDLPVAPRQAQSLPSRRRGANGLGEGSRALPCHLEIIAARSDLEPDAPRIADQRPDVGMIGQRPRSGEHTSELQSLMRISYPVLCLKKQNI